MDSAPQSLSESRTGRGGGAVGKLRGAKEEPSRSAYRVKSPVRGPRPLAPSVKPPPATPQGLRDPPATASPMDPGTGQGMSLPPRSPSSGQGTGLGSSKPAGPVSLTCPPPPAALGSELRPAGTATSGDNESLAELQNQTATEPEQPYKSLLLSMTADEKYNLIAYMCWENFSHWMMNITRAQLCEWRVISRPYSDLRHCLETFAEKQNYGYPNSIAEECIVQSHRTYFLNCTQEHPVFLDPPENVLLALILAPICLIPFLVTLVVWRSKDGKMQS
ncbi:receptor activity-modifying protein 2 isoform X2 [Chelonia mydas]|uniref:receptor activity-modifying protein 2 isoform X2 n=1 Tax=Chelonia mydas TaxID=8469 RepID=UPI001CA87E77|nr:receptor activity-modifying protein 2 isoform X2 [Chelonia mydas]